jgi:hypothetical protein
MIKYNGKLMREVWVDIDGTLAITKGNDYKKSVPNVEVVNKINQMYDQGCYIKVWTGRGSSSGIDWNLVTIDQLSKWGLKYHKLEFVKKPDMIVDDKALSVKDFIDGLFNSNPNL